jgi:hypothetical protein
MAFTLKIHGKDTPREIIAACDSEIIGRTLIDKERDIEFKISEGFYGNERLEWEKVASILINGRNVNLVGNEIIKLAIENDLVDPKNVIEIEGVKHAQIYAL